MRRLRLLALIVAVFAGAQALIPPRAHAADTVTQSLIVGGIITGATSAVLLIAILAANKNEPEFLTLARHRPLATRAPGRGSIGIGPQCPDTATGPALICW